MSNRVTSWNGFETALNGAVDASTDTMTLVSVDNLSVDTFLVIDPDVPATRDYVYITAINVGLKQITVRTPRPEEGSTGATGHDHVDGAIVRAVPVHQWMDLVFDDIETAEAWQATHAPGTDPHPQYSEAADLTTHEADASDPHAAAGYLEAADIAGKVDVAGDTMTGDLVLAGAPDADLKAATKKYVDDAIDAMFSAAEWVTGAVEDEDILGLGSGFTVHLSQVDLNSYGVGAEVWLKGEVQFRATDPDTRFSANIRDADGAIWPNATIPGPENALWQAFNEVANATAGGEGEPFTFIQWKHTVTATANENIFDINVSAINKFVGAKGIGLLMHRPAF